MQARRDLIGRELKDHAFAAAAAIKREHQSRLIAGAAKAGHPIAKRPMPSPNCSYPAFAKFTYRLPEKRAIAKEPDITRWCVCENVAYGHVVIFIGHVDRAGARACILDHARGACHKIECERHLSKRCLHKAVPMGSDENYCILLQLSGYGIRRILVLLELIGIYRRQRIPAVFLS